VLDVLEWPLEHPASGIAIVVLVLAVVVWWKLSPLLQS
jgi:hypothetical protein